MAQLQFDQVINLTEYDYNPEPKLVKKLMIGNEPKNSLWQYYITGQSDPFVLLSGENLRDKSTQVTLAKYDQLYWNEQTHSMTAHRCRDYGMKTFPGIGAIGYYTPRVGTSKILAPIHVEAKAKLTPPHLHPMYLEDRVELTITQPDDVNYLCFRIVVQSDIATFEYITYDERFTLMHPTVKGTYDIWCVGYVDEGSSVSYPSGSFSLTVTTGTDTVVPVTPTYSLASDTYTKAQIDAMIGTIASVLDTINGEVV